MRGGQALRLIRYKALGSIAVAAAVLPLVGCREPGQPDGNHSTFATIVPSASQLAASIASDVKRGVPTGYDVRYVIATSDDVAPAYFDYTDALLIIMTPERPRTVPGTVNRRAFRVFRDSVLTHATELQAVNVEWWGTGIEDAHHWGGLLIPVANADEVPGPSAEDLSRLIELKGPPDWVTT